MYEEYCMKVKERNFLKYYSGLLMRIKITFFNKRRIYKLKCQGAQIGSKTYLATGTKVGAASNLIIGNSTVVTEAVLDARGGIKIGSNVIINDNVYILTASHDYNSRVYTTIYGQVVIEDYCWIATGSTVMPGIKIGRGAVVGSGSVVTKNVEPMQIVAGNPARVIGLRENVHDKIPTESLVGADLIEYKKARKDS